MCQEAAEIVLRKEFKLPKLRLVKIKPARGNVTIAQYRQPLSFDLDNGTIEVNTHPDIRKLGGVKAIGQKTVTSGWAAQDNAILHELAHMIDYKCRDMFPLDAREQIGDRFDKLDTQKIKTILSQYGATKAEEFRAEIISGALAGNVYPEEFAKAAYLDRYTENSGMKRLYDMATGKMPNTSATEQKFANTMEVLFRQEGAQFQIDILANDKVQDFISSHAQVLDNAFKFEPMSDAMRQRLQRSNYIFSGFKTFHELNEATHALIDENGNRKPFEQFLNDVRRIDRTYNQNYLRAEYNFVHASATMAAKWEEFQQDGDRYNLQYRTAHDDKVRPEHAALDRVTLPITDPFWEEYYPPNGWNCRCTVVQVRKSKYPETPHDEAMALGEEATGKDTKGIFHFNPGIQQKTVPDYNPYTIRRCRDCDIAKGKTKLAFIPDFQLCRACQQIRECYTEREKNNSNNLKKISPEEKHNIYQKTLQEQFESIYTSPSGHTVQKHLLKDIHEMDYKRVLDAAKLFASENDVRMIPNIHESETKIRQQLGLQGKRNPDLWVGNDFVDVKSPFSAKNIVRNANEAFLQGAYACVTDHLCFLDKSKIKDYAKAIYRAEQYKKEAVFFVIDNKLYKITTADL